jgi:hypothetical protein
MRAALRADSMSIDKNALSEPGGEMGPIRSLHQFRLPWHLGASSMVAHRAGEVLVEFLFVFHSSGKRILLVLKKLTNDILIHRLEHGWVEA